MYEVWSVVLVCVKSGFPAIGVGGVDASPPPHCVAQPGVVGATAALLSALPAAMTVPVILNVATELAGRFTAPAMEFPLDPFVLHVPPFVAEHVTATEPIVAGTVSEIVVVPGPVPVLLTVTVYVMG
jgi:hypothetical protein